MSDDNGDATDFQNSGGISFQSQRVVFYIGEVEVVSDWRMGESELEG